MRICSVYISYHFRYCFQLASCLSPSDCKSSYRISNLHQVEFLWRALEHITCSTHAIRD